jgi:hypothetical protein
MRHLLFDLLNELDAAHIHVSRFRGTEAVEGGGDLLRQLIRENADSTSGK